MKIEWDYSAKYKKKLQHFQELKFKTSYLEIQYPTKKRMTAPKNHLSGYKHQMEEMPHKKSCNGQPKGKGKWCGGQIQQTKLGRGEEYVET